MTDAELAWKREGTKSYQTLSERSLRSMREVEPMTRIEADRSSQPVEPLKTLIASRRDG